MNNIVELASMNCNVEKVGVLPIRIVKSNVSSVDPLSERANAQNVRLYYPYRQNANLFIFRFVSISTLPTQHTTYEQD